MSKKLLVTIGVFILTVSPLAVAQMHGGSGAGQGRPNTGMQGGPGPGMSGGQMGSSDMSGQQMAHRRQQMHTTAQQQGQYRACSQSMNRMRGRLHEMAKLAKGQSLDRSQVTQLQDQLSSDVQNAQQELDDFVASLNDEQQQAEQKPIANLKQSAKELNDFSEQLGRELALESADPAVVRGKVLKADDAAKELQNQERDLAAGLGIEPL